MKALRTWPPRLFEVRAAFRMSKPVMLLGGGGVGGEISGPSDRADVPLVLAKPRSQSPLLWGAMLKAVSGVTVSENRLSQTVFADGGELTDAEPAWSNSVFHSDCTRDTTQALYTFATFASIASTPSVAAFCFASASASTSSVARSRAFR